MLDYLAYEWVHYRTHFGRARTSIGRGLRKRHLQHHLVRDDRWYGVTSPLWDYVFRTHVPGRSLGRSGSALGYHSSD